MRLSVGLLYAAQGLMEVLPRYLLTPSTLTELFNRDFGVPAEEALDLCMRCGWVSASTSRFLVPSERGNGIVGEDDYQERLRTQLSDFVLFIQPPWSKLLHRGRVETLVSMSPESRQCFQEAGLAMPSPTDDIVEWWDRLASCSRGLRSDLLLEIGRKGERLSIEYEEVRTGQEPKWQSIENNLAGYDILSIISGNNATSLLIEVKASRIGVESSAFHLSKNEWEIAETSENYCFHLWADVDSKPVLAVLPSREVAPHIPTDQGNGSWQEVIVSYKTFGSQFRVI